MPRSIAESTRRVYHALWFRPWACAEDLSLVTGVNASAVGNVLKRGRERKVPWLLSAKLGRVCPAVHRYVFSNAGVAEFAQNQGWAWFWWHTARGVRALARRLEVVEMAYRYLPALWQSNLVSDSSAYVVRETPGTAWLTDQPVMPVSLEESDWSLGWLRAFCWLEKGPFEAVAVYGKEDPEDGLIYLPVLWRGDFQRPRDISGVRRDMERLLVEHPRWNGLPLSQSVFGSYHPGMIVFCPDRVTGAMLQRNLVESQTDRDLVAHAAILDAQGQVIQPMSPPAARWNRFKIPPVGGDLGDIARQVDLLGQGAYAAVNGPKAWKTFRHVEGCPGIKEAQVANLVGVRGKALRCLLKPMERTKVLTVRGGGHYPDASGRGLLAASQRVTTARAYKRYGIYTKKGGEYRRGQRLHNQELAETISQLRRQGFQAWTSPGFTIDYWDRGRLVRVVPDGFVLLPPGVLVALEYEQSARGPVDVEDKASKYGHLTDIDRTLPVLFVTGTQEAADAFCRLRQHYLLATTLERLTEGPQGRMEIQDGEGGTESGCWGYWWEGMDAPSYQAPIDLWAQVYARLVRKPSWRVPLDNPWKLRW